MLLLRQPIVGVFLCLFEKTLQPSREDDVEKYTLGEVPCRVKVKTQGCCYGAPKLEGSSDGVQVLLVTSCQGKVARRTARTFSLVAMM